MRSISSSMRVVALSVAMAVMGAKATSFAGTKNQGTKNNGTLVEGTQEVRQEARSLVGFRVDPRTSLPLLIEIHHFRGDAVDATVWRTDTGPARAVLPPSDLIGLEWVEHRCEQIGICGDIRYRIIDAVQDTSQSTMPAHADNGDLWLYEVTHTRMTSPRPSDWINVCVPDRQGVARGLFVDGRWHADGAFTAGGYTFACTSGVIAKCVRDWGYKPWKQISHRGRPIDLRPLHLACIRAARADYCGDGAAQTREGTPIDLFDRYGFNVRESGPGFRREAGFTTAGAVWVERPRWPQGGEDWGAWLALPRCRRPKQPTMIDAAHTLVEVWSRLNSPPAMR